MGRSLEAPKRFEGLQRVTTVDDLPEAADPAADLGGTASRPSRRRRATTTAAAVAVVVLAGIGLAVTRTDDPEATTSPAPEVPAPSAVPVTDALASTTPADNGWVASFDGTSLERYGSTPGPELVLGGTGQQGCPAFSPDGERLLFGREDDGGNGSLEILSVADDGSVSLRSTIRLDAIERSSREDVPCASWAPDGRWAALGGGGTVWVVDTETAEVRQVPVYDPTDFEWRPGTDQLAVTGRDRPGSSVFGNHPIDLYTVSTSGMHTLDGVEAAEFTWSPDGTTIAYTQAVPEVGDNRSGISLVDADGSNPRVLTTEDWVEQGIGPVWSPSGDQIAYQRSRADCDDPACYERTEVLLVTATDDDPEHPIGTARAVPPIPNAFYGADGLQPSWWYANSVTWSPNGKALLYSGNPGLLRVPVDPARPPVVLSDEPLTNLYTDDTTKPWLALQAWQPVP